MPAVTAQLGPEDIRAVKRALEKWGAVVERRLQQATLISAKDIERDAKTQVWAGNTEGDQTVTHLGVPSLPHPPYREESNLMPHVRTGDLRASITHQRESDTLYTVTAGAGAVPYAAWVEFGTSKSRPHPFMFPAAEMNRAKWNDRIRKAIADPTGVSEVSR